jgi:WD40 repeat protein
MLLTIDYPGDIDLLRFSPAGTRLALAQDWRQEEGGELLVVVEIPSGKEVTRYADLQGVQDMLFRSEEELFIFHGFDCWLCSPGKKPRPMLGEVDKQRGPTNTGALSPDGKTLAVGANELFLVDVARRRIRTRLATPTAGYVSATAFSPDGRYLAVGSVSNEWPQISFVLVWDVQREERVALVKRDAKGFGALAFRPDNRLLAEVDGQGGTWIQLFCLDDQTLRRSDLDELCGRTFSSEYNLFFGTAWTEPVASLAPAGSMIQTLRFSADGRILKAVCYGGSAVRRYSPSGRVLSHSRPPEGDQFAATAVSSRGVAAGALQHSSSILFWDVPRWGNT